MDAKGLDFPMIATTLTGQRVSNQEGICPFSMAAERGAVKLYEISLCVNRGRQREPGDPAWARLNRFPALSPAPSLTLPSLFSSPDSVSN